jgi:hypothetical protein
LKEKEHYQYKGVNLNYTVLPCYTAYTDIYLADFEIKQSAAYNDSGSDSGDQFKLTGSSESEEEDNLQGDVEVESEDESEKKATKVKAKKGNLKPGRKHIIATRKTHATAGTPSVTTNIKSGAHENEGNTR